MNKVITLLVALAFVLPIVAANDVYQGVGITMETEEFEPLIWLCDSRALTDDNVEPWRDWDQDTDYSLGHRLFNYAFEGEQIAWDVLVMDKNGIEKISDVYVTVGTVQGVGNDIEANCRISDYDSNLTGCNARIGEEELTTFDPLVMGWYTCIFTVESPLSMYGEYWVTIEVEDLEGATATVDENEYWFFNPVIALSIEGNIDFGIVRPGTVSYSDTLLVGNDADEGSGVILDMFVTGTDFTDPMSSGAACPTTNELDLTNFRYYVVNGAWDSTLDGRAAPFGPDPEGYLGIQYGDHFHVGLYGVAEILQANPINGGDLGFAANFLTPGAEMALTFKLALPEPCVGDFSDGSIFFFGEAI